MIKLRYITAGDSTKEQRRIAQASPLFCNGDMTLVWVNDEDLQKMKESQEAVEVVSEEANLLPEFHQLLRTAFEADEEVELFNLHSESQESREQWKRLQTAATEAKSELISFIKAHKELLPQIVSLTQ
jgi:hypothetical protein